MNILSVVAPRPCFTASNSSRLQVTVVEETSKGDMLLKTGQMAVRVMRDFQVHNQQHCSVQTISHSSSGHQASLVWLARCIVYCKH